MTLEIIFKRLGLPKHSAALFRLLQTKGSLLPAHIAQLLNIHRPAVYRALQILQKHHFVYTSREGNRTLYNAADPALIAKEFSQAAETVSKELATQTIKKDVFLNKEVCFLHGPKGIRQAFDDAISHTPKGQTFYRYTSEQDLDMVNKYLSPGYRARRDAKKLERLVISNPESGSRKRPRLERFVKFIPPEVSLFKQNIIQLIYGDRVALIDLNTEQAVIIENKQLADFQKVIFRQLYKKLN